MKDVFSFAIVIVFPFLWCFVCYILAKMGGWAALATKYRTASMPPGKWFVFQSGMIGTVNYKSCLTIGVSDSGLYLSVFPLFRVGHPPLLIPWSDCHGLREKKAWFWRLVEMQIGEPAITTLTLPSWLIEQRHASV